MTRSPDEAAQSFDSAPSSPCVIDCGNRLLHSGCRIRFPGLVRWTAPLCAVCPRLSFTRDSVARLPSVCSIVRQGRRLHCGARPEGIWRKSPILASQDLEKGAVLPAALLLKLSDFRSYHAPNPESPQTLERFPRKRGRFRDKKSAQNQYFGAYPCRQNDSVLAGYALVGWRETPIVRRWICERFLPSCCPLRLHVSSLA